MVHRLVAHKGQGSRFYIYLQDIFRIYCPYFLLTLWDLRCVSFIELEASCVDIKWYNSDWENSDSLIVFIKSSPLAPGDGVNNLDDWSDGGSAISKMSIIWKNSQLGIMDICGHLRSTDMAPPPIQYLESLIYKMNNPLGNDRHFGLHFLILPVWLGKNFIELFENIA